jgi:hypothetical protein
MTTAKPVQPQIVMITITYRAWDGELRNCCGGTPTRLRK